MFGPSLARYAALLLVAAGASACVPWPRKALVVPGITVRVTNRDGAPLPGAQVTLIRYSYPHAVYQDHAGAPVDAEGRAVFAETKAWETVWPLVPHGIPFYDFVYCVSAPAHAAVAGPVPDPVTDLTVRLPAGQGECPAPEVLLQRARSATVAYGSSGD